MKWLLVALLLTGCQTISDMGFRAADKMIDDGIPIITLFTYRF